MGWLVYGRTNRFCSSLQMSSSFALDAVLEGGPWTVAGKPIILRKWGPRMSIEKDKVSKIPVWMHFYNVPLEYWTPEGLSYIASMVGKPLHVDKMTASRRRITYARICIEVDAQEDWITNFALEAADSYSGIDPITIQIENQWTPTRCVLCKCFGHDCNRKNQTQSTFSNLSRQNTSQQWIPIKKTLLDPKSVSTPPGKVDEGQWTEVLGKGKTKVVAASEVQGGANSFYVQRIASPKAQQITTNNSFNELIPYVYDIDVSVSLDTEHQHDSSSATLEEGNFEEDEFNEGLDDEEFDVTLVNPTSNRKKKREAKMMFSGSRPKGRHRP